MPRIPYLHVGDTATAKACNLIFDELDRKVTLAMSGRSLLYFAFPPRDGISEDFDRDMFGALFLFANASQRNLTKAPQRPALAELVPYFHPTFTSVANNFPQSQWVFDHTQKILTVPDNLSALDRSLEAHTRRVGETSYYLFSPFNLAPQRKLNYALADIIVEGFGSTLEMLAVYNKYNFFRFHNLQNATLTVNFRKTDNAVAHTLSVPPFGSRCVRRTVAGDDSVYTNGGNHYQRFLAGDTLFCSLYNGANNVVGPFRAVKKVWQHMCSEYLHRSPHEVAIGAGNRTLAYYISNEGLRGNSRAPFIYMNPHEVNDISGDYARVLAPPTDTALVGDCLYHKGTFIDRRVAENAVTDKEVLFSGFAALEQDMAAQGFTVTTREDGDLEIKSSEDGVIHDAIFKTTNLLMRPGGFPVVDLSGPRTIYNGLEVESGRVTRYTLALNGFDNRVMSPSFVEPGIVGGTANRHQDLLTAIEPGAFNLRIQSHTVADLKTLAPVGTGTGNQDTPAVNTYEDRKVTLTSYGLSLTFTQKLSAAYPLHTLNANAYSIMEAGRAELEGTTFSLKMRLTANSPSWPAEYEFLMLTPREPRNYEKMQQVEVNRHLHPFTVDELSGNDGADFTIPEEVAFSENSPHAFLYPVPLDSFGFLHASAVAPVIPESFDMLNYLPEIHYPTSRGAVLSNTVGLLRSGFTKYALMLPFTVEHYNNMAAVVNAMEFAKPAEFQHNHPVTIRWPVTGQDFLALLLPNIGGLFNSSIRPKNQYASFSDQSMEYQVCLALGIPIKTATDFPASYHSVIGTAQREAAPYFVETGNPSPGLQWEFSHFEFRESGNLSLAEACGAHDITLDKPKDGAVTGYYWCTIEDVRAKAAQLGVPFTYERVSHPLSLQIFTVDSFVNEGVWGLDDAYEGTSFIHVTREYLDASGNIVSNPLDATQYRQLWIDGSGKARWIQARYACFVTASSAAGCDWVCDDPFPRVYRPPGISRFPVNEFQVIPSFEPDIFTSLGNNGGRMYRMSLSGGDDAAFRRQLANVCVRGDLNGANQTSQYIGTAVLVQSYVTGAPRNSKVIMQPRSAYVQHSENFSLQGYTERQLDGTNKPVSALEAAKKRLPYDPRRGHTEGREGRAGNASVIPVTAQNVVGPSTPLILGFEDGETEKLVTHPGDGIPAYAVILWKDNRVDLR